MAIWSSYYFVRLVEMIRFEQRYYVQEHILHFIFKKLSNKASNMYLCKNYVYEAKNYKTLVVDAVCIVLYVRSVVGCH